MVNGVSRKGGNCPPPCWANFCYVRRALFPASNHHIATIPPPPLRANSLSYHNDITSTTNWPRSVTSLVSRATHCQSPNLVFCSISLLFFFLFFLSPSLIHLSYSISFFLVPVFNDARSASHLIGPSWGRRVL